MVVVFGFCVGLAAFLFAGPAGSADLSKARAQMNCQDLGLEKRFMPGATEIDGYRAAKGGRQKLLVSWCKGTVADEYLLLFTRGGMLYHPECPPYIVVGWHPLGLKLYDDDMELERFIYLDERENPQPQHGPVGVKANGSIVADSDGIAVYYYCYGGRWLYRVMD